MILLRILCLVAVIGFAQSAFAQNIPGHFTVVAVNDVFLDGKLVKKGDIFPIERYSDSVFSDQGDQDDETYLILRHSHNNRNYRVGSAKDLGLFAQSFASSPTIHNFGESVGRYIDDGTRNRIDRSTISSVNPTTVVTPDFLPPATPTN